ncbi:Transcriptional regulator, contains XRE-family HTH domain [Marinobacter daqiaonensis]|uniref:Transcriptional regulator, contains XRE-family HTH domain n=1 Tax=Marinobacter daqiaonensis TaxID=650891 RepID=A0A1I6H073_9GAMM|nr:helix-turn-helix transcriptional regulator [Marinobacter daqiaonensis]SFR47854.1 Transcriptional regulator, contains XRE-family HTH domain [Marinobacter daqiaonensis]
MRYMETFWQRLKETRENRQLSRRDVAELCGVDQVVVSRWEQVDPRQRMYPAVDELIDLCRHLEVPLESLLDTETLDNPGQLELPGLAFSNTDELGGALDELEREVRRVQPSEEEAELLRRFRKSSAENRRMILQLLGR